ncbi:type I secretion C-terminal target domain-containing protein [Mesorhizobium sp. M1E.F.Ca.ET.045.02.1.1]|uniref:DUF5801 repeats-in-toxin domain-containing protein n=1 Tax=Mesorhizobium sp. M1E.F.Ca.ET.045.02.1.1 TaxID=2493672 RepID=UPI000F75221D|nr:DUF5801 repeats-in-toxin domain-containing protein [Mesorhizobium sp. M1E.F.Ca.ET.045.02.1.1]AZO22370.1 type I secretion C-terminal target domain-containing protein [Mesorhizobium sp. M1E.F.Ca.ET.045.02.1.1]
MTTSIEFDAVSDSRDEHSTVGEHPVTAGVQVAQAASGQAAGEPVPVDVGNGAPAQGAGNAQNAQAADKPAADADAPAANAPAGNAPAANAAASNAPHEYHAEAGNVVKLPANVSIDNIKVDGHNLVLVQPDGSEIVIKDGALNVPTFIIGDVEVPRVALIAALESSHVDVAFGADGSISAGGNAPGSAGGNFSVPPGGIGDGFDLTALLPPTALQFGLLDRRELFPSVLDKGISVVATSLLSPDEAASETGLNGGPSQSPGSDAPSNSETSSTGTITIDAPDGIGSIVINGVTVTGTGQQIQGQFGYITIVSFDPNTGVVEYNYTVTESVTHPEHTDGYDPNDTVPDNFSITVTDSDGDTASTTFAVAIIDDVPTAVADTDSVAAGQIGPATGNVLVGGTDAGDANTTDGVADTQGADGATVVGVVKGTTNADLDDTSTLGVQIQGAYGKLTLHADGSYTYVRDANTPGGVNDVFTYTIKDGDGDTSHTTLTISIGNSTPEITDLTPEANGGDVTVNEDDLLASRGSGESAGSDTSKESTTQGGTFTIHSPDGIASLNIGGHDFITNGVFTAGSFTTALGNTLEVTAYNAATGEVSYTYTLNDNEAHATGQDTNSLFENFDVTLTDLDGQSASSTLSVDIVDDVPTASAEASQNVAEGATITGTLDFVAGADGATVTHIDGTLLVFGQDGYSQAIDIGDGFIKVKADGSYSFTADNPVIGTGAASATYTVTDGDGDTSTAGLSFVVTDANHPTTGTTAASVDDDGLVGGNPASTIDDINANIGDADGPASSEASFSGTLGGSVGGDGAGANGFSFAGLNGTAGTVGQENVTYGWDSGTNTLTATTTSGDRIGTALFTVHVTDPATGAYTVTLLDNVLHAGGPNDENAVDPTTSLTYTITDADNSSTTGTLTITFDDDAPTASAEAPQNVAEGGTITGTLDFVAGADGATVTHIDGTLLVFGQDGYSQSIDIGDGFIKIKADGSYSFTADSSVAGTGAASATYTVTDGDGDTATAGISFVVTDANTPTSGSAAATVDDDGLAGANAASTTGDIDANAGEVPLSASEAIYNGTLGGSLGGDGAGTNGFSFATLDGTSGTVGQENVAYSWDSGTNTLTATTTSGDRIGTALFIVHVTDPATGAYTVTLLDNVLQAQGPNNENNATVNLGYVITDADGSTAPGTLTITFNDDAPTISAPGASASLTVDETNLAVNDTQAFASAFTSSYGADGPGTITYALGFNAGATGLVDTATNQAVVLSLENGQVVGRAGVGGPIVFTVSTDASGNVTLDQQRAVVHPTSNPNEPVSLSADNLVTLTATITDKDGDSSSATLNIGQNLTFLDDGPSISAPGASASLTVDETNLAVNDTQAFASAFTSSYGADGPGTITYALGFNAGATGLVDTATNQAVVLSLENGQVVGRAGVGGPIVFTVSTDASGNVTLDQQRAVVHPTSNPNEPVSLSADNLVTLTATITDKDGDSSSATLNIGQNLTFLDDGPSISAPGASASLTVDETNLAVNDTQAFASAFTSSYGADGPGTITYALGFNAGATGLVDTATNQAVVLSLENGQVVGRAGVGGPIVFTVSTDASGNVTLDQQRAVVHPTSNPNELVSLSADNLVTLTATITDKDGDSSSATLNIGQNLTFLDDGPSISAPGTSASLTVDETNLAVNDTQAFASAFTSSYGADGPGTITYALGFNAGATGLVDTATNQAVVLSLENGQVVGRAGVGGPIVFTVSTDASGNVTLDQQRAVVHPTSNPNEPVSLSADNLVTLTATITDKDGDSSSATLNIGQNLTFLDDGPTVLDKTDLYFANSGTVSGTGVFDYSVGADAHTTYSSLNSDFAAITLAGTVAGNAISSPTVTWASETATTAVFNVSFDYLTGGVSTHETGTLTFDKVAGTYTVDLADPISAVTISTVSNSSSITGYQPGSSTIDNTQPEVAVAQVNANLFIQFTGYSEPGSGTGNDNLQAGSIDGNPLTFVNGEFITQASSYVSISGTANGVAGDTMGKGEVIDMDFFTTNPTGFTNQIPDAQVSSMFLKFDGIGNTEDFIVILKLYDPTTNLYTTKAMYVENADIFKGPGSGPGAYSSVSLDNNDGLLIIESNDYNTAGQHYVLVGAQITPTDEGITGTAINLNGAIGAGGASTTFQNLSSDTNDLGFKISDIGLVSTTTTAQNADLTFNVTVKDADGDTSTAQQLDVHVVNGVTYTGTADAETMQGTANDDILNGNGGDDILQGFAGADTLNGGDGNDLLIGGLGHDTLTGGAGADTFKLDHLELSIKDLITDYNGADGDKIDLTALFQTGGASVTDFVKYDAGTGALSVDTDGAGAGATFVEVATLTPHPAAGTINILYDDGIHAQPQTTTV